MNSNSSPNRTLTTPWGLSLWRMKTSAFAGTTTRRNMQKPSALCARTSTLPTWPLHARVMPSKRIVSSCARALDILATFFGQLTQLRWTVWKEMLPILDVVFNLHSFSAPCALVVWCKTNRPHCPHGFHLLRPGKLPEIEESDLFFTLCSLPRSTSPRTRYKAFWKLLTSWRSRACARGPWLPLSRRCSTPPSPCPSRRRRRPTAQPAWLTPTLTPCWAETTTWQSLLLSNYRQGKLSALHNPPYLPFDTQWLAQPLLRIR